MIKRRQQNTGRYTGWWLIVPLLAMCLSLTAQDVEIKNHFDVVQQLATMKSKSRQLVVMGRKNIAADQQDSLQMMYMDLKATNDGVIGKYKSLIDNPSLARKTGESIGGDFNRMQKQLNEMSAYYLDHARSSGSMGYKPIGVFALVTGVISIGKDLYTEIKNLQKTRRDANKAEVDQYVLPDWDAVK